MTFLIDNWYLILAALVSGGMLAWPAITRGSGAKVTTAEAVKLINRERAVLIDVSDAAEFAAGHAAGAKNVPLATLEKATALPKNKAVPVVVLCRNGARASRGVAILKRLGYEKATALAGGLTAWREANLPIEKSA